MNTKIENENQFGLFCLKTSLLTVCIVKKKINIFHFKRPFLIFLLLLNI